MKSLFTLLCILLIAASCGTNKDYLERNDKDKALMDAIKKLSKDPTNEKAISAIPVLYKTVQQTHTDKIKAYSNDSAITRWDKLLKEYEYLQNSYDAIINSPEAYKLVSPQSYGTELLETKQHAAEAYYQEAILLVDRGGRDNAKKAYGYFKRSDRLIPGFKDAADKMQQVYESAVVDVVINPVEDNSFFYNNGWGNNMANYNNQYFQEKLVKELNTLNSNRYPARFYTDWQASVNNLQPDWQVDLRLRQIYIPQPSYYNYARNASAQIEIGRDTAGRPVLSTVYATVNITRMSFTARADMEVNIKDLSTKKNIAYNSFDATYDWQEEKATYNGDQRALSGNDWDLINNGRYYAPRKEDILEELYRKIYPQVKNQIMYSVDW